MLIQMIYLLSVGSTVVSIDNKEKEVVIRLEDLLAFTTGADKLPPMGFKDTLKIMFLEDSKLPKASTCGLCLFLPLKANNYDDFKDNNGGRSCWWLWIWKHIANP